MQSTTTSITGEEARIASMHNDRSTDKNLQQVIGTVIEVHEKLPMVKVEIEQGYQILGGSFIPLSHSVLDIVHRFGALRPGLRVLVTSTGDVERNAIATIVGVEGEKLGVELVQENDLETGPYGIFTPGSL